MQHQNLTDSPPLRSRARSTVAPQARTRIASTLRMAAILLALSMAGAACGNAAIRNNPQSHINIRGTKPADAARSPHGVKTMSGPAICSVLAGATKTFSSAPSGSSPSALATAYSNLKLQEPKIEQAAPRSIRHDFETLFSVLNSFYSTLATVGYEYTRLSSATASRLSNQSRQLAPVARAINAYLAANCAATRSRG